MDSSAICEYILSRIDDQLSPYGYFRSGKSSVFYRYSVDKKVATAIEMQKSMFNCSGSYSFTFNLLCIGLYDLDDFYNEKLTLAALKKSLKSPYLAERIGHLCRGTDYWYIIDTDVLKEYTPAEYYEIFISKDIDKAAMHLDDLFQRKERRYL